jgi:hypothetical protein
MQKAAAFCICYVGKPSDAMIQYTVRRLSKKSKGGRIIIALLGNESDAVTPGTRDITAVVGNFGCVADFIAETAAQRSRAPAAAIVEADEVAVTAEH